jgi:hypothetical protein
MAALTRKKSLASFLEEAARDAAHGGAKMSLFDLLCVGIGGTVGSGEIRIAVSPQLTLTLFFLCL